MSMQAESRDPRTHARVRQLHATFLQSPWRKERELRSLRRVPLSVDMRISWKHICSTGIGLLIFVGKFSRMVTDTPTLMPLEELQKAAAEGRIQEKDVAAAAKAWNSCLGAQYMRDQAIQMGVPPIWDRHAQLLRGLEVNDIP